jgi:hypothetical protein
MVMEKDWANTWAGHTSGIPLFVHYCNSRILPLETCALLFPKSLSLSASSLELYIASKVSPGLVPNTGFQHVHNSLHNNQMCKIRGEGLAVFIQCNFL